MNILDQITQDYKKNDVPEFNVGDTVKVHVKIIEGQRENPGIRRLCAQDAEWRHFSDFHCKKTCTGDRC